MNMIDHRSEVKPVENHHASEDRPGHAVLSGHSVHPVRIHHSIPY